MNNETKTPNTRITYLDGHADEVCVTMWQRCQAETHAKTKGLGQRVGRGGEAQRLRRLRALPPNRRYLCSVRAVGRHRGFRRGHEQRPDRHRGTGRNHERPRAGLFRRHGGRAGFFDRCDRWDSGGFGELSCVLAARFGGTPWAWRRESQPQEADWGTCVSLLRQEAEETEDIRRRTR